MISHGARVGDLIRLGLIRDVVLMLCVVGHVMDVGVVVSTAIDLAIFWIAVVIILLFMLDSAVGADIFMVLVIILLVAVQEVPAPTGSEVMLSSRVVGGLMVFGPELDFLWISEIDRIRLSSTVVVLWFVMV